MGIIGEMFKLFVFYVRRDSEEKKFMGFVVYLFCDWF